MSDVEVTNEAGVRWIALNRPESKNGLTDAVNAALIEALDGAAADKAIRCVVVTGKGGNFCSGLDLKAMADPKEADVVRKHIKELGGTPH